MMSGQTAASRQAEDLWGAACYSSSLHGDVLMQPAVFEKSLENAYGLSILLAAQQGRNSPVELGLPSRLG